MWTEHTSENVRRLLQALEDFGFGSVGLEETDVLEPEEIIQLGYPPLRIDLLTSETSVAFEEWY